MYTFIILTMPLCAQRTSCPKRTEWNEDLIHTYTHTHTTRTSRIMHGKYYSQKLIYYYHCKTVKEAAFIVVPTVEMARFPGAGDGHSCVDWIVYDRRLHQTVQRQTRIVLHSLLVRQCRTSWTIKSVLPQVVSHLHTFLYCSLPSHEGIYAVESCIIRRWYRSCCVRRICPL